MKAAQRQLAEGILFTDEYQLTMAQLYFRAGIHEKPAQFEHFFRSYPDYGAHQAGFCINAGLQWFLDWMEEARFREEDIACLRSQRGRTGKPLFAEDFLRWLHGRRPMDHITMRAIPEGRVVHPNVPLTVVEGPLAMAQLLETPLLNFLNFQTLIATKAARVRESCGVQVVLEFGLRRGPERGSNAGARAALIGGADFTSNVGISHGLGYPPQGTHAHSMVQAFIALGASELDAFRAFAEVYPDDCILLVDTIDTLESGVPNAIKVFEELRRKGHEPVGIRLDSGDLAYLSIQAAKMLDEAGFPNTTIVLSSNLDELVIWQIVTQIRDEAPRYGVDPERLIRRLTYGVGTRLITSHGHSALDGVYKLVAVRNRAGWEPAIKISETPDKTLNPGEKRIWRIYDRRGKATADLLSLPSEDPRQAVRLVLHHPSDPERWRVLTRDEIAGIEPLLVDILSEGKLVYDLPSIEEIRALRRADVERLDAGVKRLVNPHIYHVSLSEGLWNLKQELIQTARQRAREDSAPGQPFLTL
ncbi:MAG: nicotinate phosphoribosyltransferase [Anaerolineae bacterium]